MRRLEELGISPTPWRFSDDGMGECDIRCSGVSYGDDYEGEDIIAQSVQKKDASMLAAAPKLYKALRFAYGVIFENWAYDNDDFEMIKAALAEAAGEEVDDGK